MRMKYTNYYYKLESCSRTVHINSCYCIRGRISPKVEGHFCALPSSLSMYIGLEVAHDTNQHNSVSAQGVVDNIATLYEYVDINHNLYFVHDTL